ncbi:hypothetical protein CEXT_183141 [Caerostris extrusa]|uniref:Uncharacterized protein n=1 Tax=Caerostris extrusa TaxID=172846 RepID=A0AAV4TQW1_CAEEX|nr:hypothetical protein CEXT_183141 [Caerostris extrusa]
MTVFSGIACLYTFKSLWIKIRLGRADPPEDDDPRLECGPDPWNFVAQIDWEVYVPTKQCPQAERHLPQPLQLHHLLPVHRRGAPPAGVPGRPALRQEEGPLQLSQEGKVQRCIDHFYNFLFFYSYSYRSYVFPNSV